MPGSTITAERRYPRTENSRIYQSFPCFLVEHRTVRLTQRGTLAYVCTATQLSLIHGPGFQLLSLLDHFQGSDLVDD